MNERRQRAAQTWPSAPTRQDRRNELNGTGALKDLGGWGRAGSLAFCNGVFLPPQHGQDFTARGEHAGEHAGEHLADAFVRENKPFKQFIETLKTGAFDQFARRALHACLGFRLSFNVKQVAQSSTHLLFAHPIPATFCHACASRSK